MDIQNNIGNETDILQYAAESGIINVADIRDAVEQMNKKQMLSLHSQKIWQGKDRCWHTHLIMEDGKRVVRHRKTKEELEL